MLSIVVVIVSMMAIFVPSVSTSVAGGLSLDTWEL